MGILGWSERKRGVPAKTATEAKVLHVRPAKGLRSLPGLGHLSLPGLGHLRALYPHNVRK